MIDACSSSKEQTCDRCGNIISAYETRIYDEFGELCHVNCYLTGVSKMHEGGSMNFDEYQVEAEKTAIYPDKGNNLNYPIVGLVGEAGELANLWAKYLRGDVPMSPDLKSAIASELGDVLWYLTTCCEELGISLDVVARKNVVKLKGRKDRGTVGGNGEHR